jgi:hypothetical protein
LLEPMHKIQELILHLPHRIRIPVVLEIRIIPPIQFEVHRHLILMIAVDHPLPVQETPTIPMNRAEDEEGETRVVEVDMRGDIQDEDNTLLVPRIVAIVISIPPPTQPIQRVIVMI